MEVENNLISFITIIGKGVPSNYEISVNGTIEMIDDDPLEEAGTV